MERHRHRAGPVTGTVVLCVLTLMGVYGIVTVGFQGMSTGSVVFSLVVIGVFALIALSGLDDLRGVRTVRGVDGRTALWLPRPGLTPARWWRVLPAEDIVDLDLTRLRPRGRLYLMEVVLQDGRRVTTGAVGASVLLRRDLRSTRAWAVVEQIRRELGLAAGPADVR